MQSSPRPGPDTLENTFGLTVVELEDPVLPTASVERARRLPAWLKRPLPASGGMGFTQALVGELGLETVCESAKCPNRSECWSRKTATFMIMGEVCTRPCGFCAVPRGKPEELASDEPERLAEACFRLGLKHVVVTSVTRDDLPGGGADHFRRCILAVRARTGATIEVLTPDFDGDASAIDVVLSAAPEVFNHNIETVARLQRKVRRKSQYAVSLGVLAHAKKSSPQTLSKSGIMLGLGETVEETIECMADLRSVGCDLLTIGQYLQPSPKHLPVERYVHPDEFDALAQRAAPWASWTSPAVHSCGRATTPTPWPRSSTRRLFNRP